MTVTAFDPLRTAAADEDPDSVYRQLRDETPFYHDERWDLWVVSRFEDVQDALRDWRTFSQEPDVDIDGFMDELLDADGNILVMDPPRHTALRRLVQATNAFSAASIGAMEPRITALVDGLIDGMLAGGGRADAVGAPLARLEAKVALERFLARIPDYELDGPYERITRQNLRGLKHLPIRF
jgi:cytochrome P450